MLTYYSQDDISLWVGVLWCGLFLSACLSYGTPPIRTAIRYSGMGLRVQEAVLDLGGYKFAPSLWRYMVNANKTPSILMAIEAMRVMSQFVKIAARTHGRRYCTQALTYALPPPCPYLRTARAKLTSCGMHETRYNNYGRIPRSAGYC